jgi:RNA polymerase sigma-70 factor (ECF subfamily)
MVRRAVINLAGPQLEADDVVQDVMVEVLESWDTFRGGATLRTWIYGVAHRVVLAARRRARFRRLLGLDRIPDPATTETLAVWVERREAALQLHALLNRLSERKRTVVVLFELEGLSRRPLASSVSRASGQQCRK